MGDPYVISGAHGDGVYYLIEDILETFPEPEKEEEEAKHPVFAVIGRPNVGKSTLVNAILGEERVIAFDMAGTTRDSIHIDFEREGKPFTIIDTAGVRRRGKVDEAVEKFSVIKAMQAVEADKRCRLGIGCATRYRRPRCDDCRFRFGGRPCLGRSGQ